METDNQNDYFESYEDLEIHKLMLRDGPRNKAYHDAIHANKDFIKNKVVLDVGAGTGILSVFCAQIGARKVYAVEASETYKICEDVVRENGFENVITVIHSPVENIPQGSICEEVDIIISEWMGFYLFHEGMLNSVIVAREKYLKSDGIIFPESATLYAAPCSVPMLYSDWDNVNGVLMSCFASRLRQEAYKKPLAEVISPDCILSDPEVVLWIDLRDVSPEDISTINLRHVAVANKPGRYQGICLWFSCTFPMNNLEEPVVLETGPEFPATHWKQTLIVLPVDTAVEPNYPICYDLLLRQSTDSRRYIIEVEMKDAEEVEHPEFCECHMTKCILVRAMLENYESGKIGVAGIKEDGDVATN